MDLEGGKKKFPLHIRAVNIFPLKTTCGIIFTDTEICSVPRHPRAWNTRLKCWQESEPFVKYKKCLT